jgi:hypothetical protein
MSRDKGRNPDVESPGQRKTPNFPLVREREQGEGRRGICVPLHELTAPVFPVSLLSSSFSNLNSLT